MLIRSIVSIRFVEAVNLASIGESGLHSEIVDTRFLERIYVISTPYGIEVRSSNTERRGVVVVPWSNIVSLSRVEGEEESRAVYRNAFWPVADAQEPAK